MSAASGETSDSRSTLRHAASLRGQASTLSRRVHTAVRGQTAMFGSRGASLGSSSPGSLYAAFGATDQQAGPMRRGCSHYSAMVVRHGRARVRMIATGVRRHPLVERLLVFCRRLKAWHRHWMRRAKPWCLKGVESPGFQSIMMLVTVYALVGDDIRVSGTSKPADLGFNIVTMLAFLLFSVEMVAACIGKDDYALSFFFWLDFVATLSLILDITWVYALLIQESSGGKNGDTSVARAGRMSRVGTRAGRVIRLIRLIRLLRIIKLYKHISDGIRRLRGIKNGVGQRPGENTDEEVYAESRVGQKLSHMTTQKVILLILLMLITLPIMSVEEFFRDLPTSSQYGADAVYRSYVRCTADLKGSDEDARSSAALSCKSFEQQLIMYIGYHHRMHVTSCDTGWNQVFSTDCQLDLCWIGFKAEEGFRGFERRSVEEHWEFLFAGSPFVTAGALEPSLKSHLLSRETVLCPDFGAEYVYLPLLSEVDVVCPDQLRLDERDVLVPRLISDEPDPGLVLIFDLRPWMLRYAVFNIMQTVFICIILAAGAMVFSHDANVLVLQPIERMMFKVQKIRDNPLNAMKLGDERGEDAPKSEGTEGSASRCSCLRRGKDAKVQTLETKILENAIIKLGKLLALGFGEAGSEIIGKNMDDDSATVNAMIPGSRVEAVFGFCELRSFTDTTEVLQDKVMVFVNQVAEIVHNIVDEWHGAPNRNIGDAFLIVWRMKEDFAPWERERVGDMSVMSFVQVVAAINKSCMLKEYREHPALIARLPNYQVRLGFGLHYGWAIEGAIGSEFKIDASYLSPHVNMASRLEAIAPQYQVPILMSNPLAQLCSHDMARYFRTIDHVTLKGGMSTAMRLHTVDIVAENLSSDAVAPKRSEIKRLREKTKEEKFRRTFKVHELFETNSDLRQMRKDFPKSFFQLFSKGYLNYEAGEWDVARDIFERTREMLPEPDGPSRALLDFMGRHGYDPTRVGAKGWHGYRELAET